MAKKKTPIKYTHREYDSIRADLIQHARRYYPEIIRDFSEASFGAMMIDSTAYIGDMLSFYLDYQANESNLDINLKAGPRQPAPQNSLSSLRRTLLVWE